MKTTILSGLGCNDNNTAVKYTAPVPVEGLGELFGAVQNLENAKAKGLPTAPAKAVLNKVISNTSDAMIKQAIAAKNKTLPAVKPVVKPILPSSLPVVNPTSQVKTPVLPVQKTIAPTTPIATPVVKNSCDNGKTCATPVRSMPAPVVKLDPQTAKKPVIQIRAHNAAERNAMTRVAIEPIKQMLQANLQVCLRNPDQLAPFYIIPIYTQYLREALAAWDEPAALIEVMKKYKGKYEKYSLQAGSTVNGLGDFFDNVRGWGDAIGDTAKTVGKLADDAFTSIKGVITKVADVIGDIGRAIGEGIKNAAVWVVGMIQKYNPVMIAARSAFRGLVAIDFRNWASDMQGMRERGEEDKIRETWTGTFVGGDWGDLAASINAGSGRDKRQPAATTFEPAVETVNAPPPFPEPIYLKVASMMTPASKAAAELDYKNQVIAYNRKWRTEYIETAPAPIVYAPNWQDWPKGMSQDNIDKYEAYYKDNTYTPALTAYNKLYMKPASLIAAEAAARNAKISPAKPVVAQVITPASNPRVTIKKFVGTTNVLKGFGNLGVEPITTTVGVVTATPVIAYVTSIITAAKDIKEKYIDPAVKAGEDIKKLVDPFLPTDKPISPPNGGGANPQPVDPYNPNNGGINPPAASNTMLYAGIGIAAVLALVLMSSSNAKPSNAMNGLEGLKKATKTIKTFKL